MWTEKSYGDCELIYDWRLPDAKVKSKSGLLLKGTGKAVFALRDAKGGWHRTHVVRKGADLIVTVDGGEAVVSTIPDWKPGKKFQMGLMGLGSVEFAGIYVLVEGD